jgi:hypothetical protein
MILLVRGRVLPLKELRIPSLEIIFGDLPVKMTSTNEFVPVMKQNVPVIVPDCKNIGYKICNG